MYHIFKKFLLIRSTVILLVIGLFFTTIGYGANTEYDCGSVPECTLNNYDCDKVSRSAEDDFAPFPTDDRSAESMVFDLVLVRPLGVVGIVFGTVAFILAVPFSAPGNNIDEAYQRLMADPARYTFKRPLGCF